MNEQPIIKQFGEIATDKGRTILTFRLYEGASFYANEINGCTVEQISLVGLVERYEISLELSKEPDAESRVQKINQAFNMICQIIKEEQEADRKVEADHAVPHSAHSLVAGMPYNPND